MRSPFASLRVCGAQGWSIRFSMSGKARELDICRLEGALHIPMAEIPAQSDNLPTDQLLVVICHHGARSQMVVDFLRSAGFDNAVNLDGGIDAWACDVDPSMPRYR
jgi:rhodanese-related sulfurtransferase